MECSNCIHVEVSGSLSENIVSESSINQFKPNKSKVHCCETSEMGEGCRNN